jgi:hypothetical protein
MSNERLATMNSTRALCLRHLALLMQLVAVFAALISPAAAQAANAPAAMEVAVSAPIDVSPDGELLLLFLPAGQGFELVNTRTGERDIVSDTPNTGYFATLSPDKKYVCFKDFQAVGNERLQVPVLYDIAGKKQAPLGIS